MLKRIFLIAAAILLLFGSISASALGMTGSSVLELSRKAEHYYDTNINYADMMLTHVNESLYTVNYYAQSGKALELQIYKTEWGTWNLGEWYINDGETHASVIGGGTDWEYVFRVVNPITQGLDFTGGNHGSEVCNSLKMYEAVTGLELTLGIGESMYVSRLVIEENTSVLLANLSYMPYANVKRKYTVVGNTVNLDCEMTFLKDVKMAQSYTAMAAVNKRFSRYIDFDGILSATAQPEGSYNNQYYGKVNASVCNMSGDDKSATVTVGIFNKEDMTDNFSNINKTFLWDMSEMYNKLYFSKYDLTTLRTVEEGTVWKFASFWRINLN